MYVIWNENEIYLFRSSPFVCSKPQKRKRLHSSNTLRTLQQDYFWKEKIECQFWNWNSNEWEKKNLLAVEPRVEMDWAWLSISTNHSLILSNNSWNLISIRAETAQQRKGLYSFCNLRNYAFREFVCYWVNSSDFIKTRKISQ